MLRRDTHHLGTAPGHRTHIAIADAKLLHHKLGGFDQRLAGIGDLESQRAGGFQKTLGVLLDLEDTAVVHPLALEHAARVVQAVAQHVQLRVAPRYERAIEPDDTVAIVVGDKVGHGAH